MSENLIWEMIWVLKINGKLIEISNGVETKRMPVFKELAPNANISTHELKLSGLATVINVLRTGLKDKPLSESIKNPKLLKLAFMEAFDTKVPE